MSNGALVALDIAGPGDRWGELGLMIADEVTQVGEVTLRFGQEGEGIVGWALHGPDGPRDLDGLSTTWLPEPVEPSAPREHRLAYPCVDHVVIATPDPRRTFACFESAGLKLRREREAGSEQRPLVQGFFRHGEAIVEVVGPREATDDGPATFWGLTLVAEDLDAAVTALGRERCEEPREAVQPGRRIAALRRGAELPTRVALISPGACAGLRHPLRPLAPVESITAQRIARRAGTRRVATGPGGGGPCSPRCRAAPGSSASR